MMDGADIEVTEQERLWQARAEQAEQELANEIADMMLVAGEVSKVYDELTYGKLSKPNTRADAVIDAVRDRQQEDIEEAIKEATQDLERELEALIGASTGRLHDCDDACTWAHSEYAKLLMKGQREAERELADLLARIHRDGGHHTGEVGVEQSVKDAHLVWANLIGERDEALAQVERVKALPERWRETGRALTNPLGEMLTASADELEAALGGESSTCPHEATIQRIDDLILSWQIVTRPEIDIARDELIEARSG